MTLNNGLKKNQGNQVKNYFTNYAAEYYNDNYSYESRDCYSYSHIVRKNHILQMVGEECGRSEEHTSELQSH